MGHDVNINTRRQRLEEAARRRIVRQRAERLSGLRGRFIKFMDERGYSDAERERELSKLDETIEKLSDMAEEGAIDEHPEAW